MNILALDTATSMLSVALKKGSSDIQELTLSDRASHSENLHPFIDQLLKKNRLQLSDIGTFLINRGPGSFTGLRIGFASLKGFMTVRKKPCYGASCLDMIAQGIPVAGRERLGVAVDAHRSRIYTRYYKSVKNSWKPAGKAKVLSVEELVEEAPQDCFFAGDAFARYREPFENLITGKQAVILAVNYWYPKASTLIRTYLAEKAAGKKRGSVSRLVKPADFIPDYIRSSEAEERKRKHAANR